MLFLSLFILILYGVFFVFKLLCYAEFSKKNNDSPFECGITSNKSSRKPYSLTFFIITMIFLLFDIEMILLTPFLLFAVPLLLVNMSIYIYLLFFGLVLEWNMNSLEWSCN